VKKSLILEKKKKIQQEKAKEVRNAFESKEMVRKHNNFPVKQ